MLFNSYDPLVPRDQNDAADVYLWQRADDKAGCEALGAEHFAPTSGGCLSLISSGTGTEDAEALDASVDGRDLFFTTATSLLPTDPTQVDLYDARVGGGFPQPVEAPGCDVDAHQCRPEAQAPPAAPAPASDRQRQGNPRPTIRPKPRKCPRGTHRMTRKGKTRCVANGGKGKGVKGRSSRSTKFG
jgi:hypothetical protein